MSMLLSMLLPLLGKMFESVLKIFFQEVLTTPAIEKETINVETTIEPTANLDNLKWL